MNDRREPETPPGTFLGLAPEDSTFERARALLLPVPYDATASYRPGARLGPAAILDASRYVETYDEELDLNVEEIGFRVLPEVAGLETGAGEMVRAVHRAASGILERAGDRFLLTLGGEHSVTPGVVRAFAERHENLSVLHLDAHGDLREDYEGDRHSHACACRRIRDHVGTTVSAGVRSLSAEEAELIRAEEIPVYFARDIVGRADWIDEAVERLAPEVYVTVDLDVFDPSVMPSTGTPEPGGLGWYDVLRIVRTTAERRRIVGADIVELAPIPGRHAPDFMAARLAVKILAYVLGRGKGRE